MSKTRFSLVRLLARVRPQVRLQRGRAGVRFAADEAQIGSVAVVVDAAAVGALC